MSNEHPTLDATFCGAFGIPEKPAAPQRPPPAPLDLAALRHCLDRADYGPMRMVGEDGDYTIVDQLDAEVATVRDRHVAELIAALVTQAPSIVSALTPLDAAARSLEAWRLVNDELHNVRGQRDDLANAILAYVRAHDLSATATGRALLAAFARVRPEQAAMIARGDVPDEAAQ